jgi:hypothetical protein
MSVYLDLLPAPQFDRSLVTYTVANFQRIKEAFIRTSSRVYVIQVQSNGAWPKSFTVNHPFRADVSYLLSASCSSNAVGPAGLAPQLDGSSTGLWAYTYFNEANSHKWMTGGGVNRQVASGNHTWAIAPANASTISDSFDWGMFMFTMVEA